MKSKQTNIVIFVLVAVFVFYDKLPSLFNGEEPTSAPVVPAIDYSLRPTENTWPPMGTAAPAALASDLLAPNYYVIFDGSGSMEERECSGNKTKLEAAKDALKVFAGQLPRGANVGLYTFDTFGRRETVSLSSESRDAFIRAVQNSEAGSGTPLLTAITGGYEALTRQAVKQLGYGEYHLVVVTDGEANDGEDPRPIVKRLLSESPVILHTIGFCIGEQHSLNQPGLVDYRAADDPQSLKRSIEAVLAEAPVFDIDTFKRD